MGTYKGKVEKIVTKIDKKDRKIASLLSMNSQMTLKELSKEVGMSLDGVRNRIEKMKKSGAIERFSIVPDPAQFGFPSATHVYLKLKNLDDENLKRLKTYLKSQDRVILLMGMLGDYDLFFVMHGKNTLDIYKQKEDIRKKFSDIIDDWKEVIAAEVYKYEEYSF